jgi:hypothetical protein
MIFINLTRDMFIEKMFMNHKLQIRKYTLNLVLERIEEHSNSYNFCAKTIILMVKIS